MTYKKKLKEGILDPVAPHYEEDFTFPLMDMIRKRAEEKDISYCQAAAEVEPIYSKMTRIRDEKFTDEMIWHWDEAHNKAGTSGAVEGYTLGADSESEDTQLRYGDAVRKED